MYVMLRKGKLTQVLSCHAQLLTQYSTVQSLFHHLLHVGDEPLSQ